MKNFKKLYDFNYNVNYPVVLLQDIKTEEIYDMHDIEIKRNHFIMSLNTFEYTAINGEKEKSIKIKEYELLKNENGFYGMKAKDDVEEEYEFKFIIDEDCYDFKDYSFPLYVIDGHELIDKINEILDKGLRIINENEDSNYKFITRYNVNTPCVVYEEYDIHNDMNIDNYKQLIYMIDDIEIEDGYILLKNKYGEIQKFGCYELKKILIS